MMTVNARLILTDTCGIRKEPALKQKMVYLIIICEVKLLHYVIEI